MTKLTYLLLFLATLATATQAAEPAPTWEQQGATRYPAGLVAEWRVEHASSWAGPWLPTPISPPPGAHAQYMRELLQMLVEMDLEEGAEPGAKKLFRFVAVEAQ